MGNKGELKYDLLIKKRDRLMELYNTNPTKKLQGKITNTFVKGEELFKLS